MNKNEDASQNLLEPSSNYRLSSLIVLILTVLAPRMSQTPRTVYLLVAILAIIVSLYLLMSLAKAVKSAKRLSKGFWMYSIIYLLVVLYSVYLNFSHWQAAS